MDDTIKYLIHADVTADGVVERTDVVGAVFGQTEGLLGEEMDLRGLQQSSKVGRIDVEIDSERGQSHGTLTIETSLDKVETATLAAALETITRIGPCRAEIQVTEVEDVRAAKRRKVVDRATELLKEGFTESMMSSHEILESVREEIRVGNVTEYEGLPAGPRVADGDAIIVVEGRADVLTLLRYGVKNAVAVEGTGVPDPVAGLTRDRTVTAFVDGDRGGDLVLEELSQVGEIDYVAFAPPGESVEDLRRTTVYDALREKIPYEEIADADRPAESTPEARSVDVEATSDGGTATRPPDPSPSADGVETGDGTDPPPADPPAGGSGGEVPGSDPADPDANDESTGSDETTDDGETGTGRSDGTSGDDGTDASPPRTLQGHVETVIGDGTGSTRLLDDDWTTVGGGDADEAFDLLEGAEAAPAAVVIDGMLSQRILDVAAQRGVNEVVASELGEFTKRPTGVRIRTADQLSAEGSA